MTLLDTFKGQHNAYVIMYNKGWVTCFPYIYFIKVSSLYIPCYTGKTTEVKLYILNYIWLHAPIYFSFSVDSTSHFTLECITCRSQMITYRWVFPPCLTYSPTKTCEVKSHHRWPGGGCKWTLHHVVAFHANLCRDLIQMMHFRAKCEPGLIQNTVINTT